ncbi:MAG: UbiA family prenyltransferase [Candidatus Heimdallarchaeota archaeon]|nr:UbiA family prenyltransferase [Candidatus Heimdallarchaeota archaeon]
MSKVTQEKTNRFKFFKGFIGAFRLMHFLPVVTVTIIGSFIAILTLKGSGTFSQLFQDFSSGIIPISLIVFFVLTIFFQEAFCGIQNDYIDRDVDRLYNKSKALTDGWVTETFTFWFGIACFILFTMFSFLVGIWSITGYWGVLFIQGANLIGIFYNLYAKNRPISILPYIVGFPLIPVYTWITFGGFEYRQLWMIPILIFVSLPAHIANELPDLELDIKHNKHNFSVFLGKKISTILYWLGIVLIEVTITIVYIIYNLSIWVFLTTISASMLLALVTFILLWKREWKTDLLIFNMVTMCIGVQVLGFFIMLGI